METKQLRVVSFNIAGADVRGRMDGATQARSWHLLHAFGADLCLVQEAEVGAIPAWARDVWDIVDAPDPKLQLRIPWGSVIVARKGLGLRSRADLFDSDPWLAVLRGYVALGEVDVPGSGPTLVASIHAPARPLDDYLKTCVIKDNPLTAEDTELVARDKNEVWVCDLVFHALKRHTGGRAARRFIVGGDWNLSRLFDVRDKDRKAGQPPWGALFFARTEDASWSECHGHKNEERSFIGHQGKRPHQLDHLFCDWKTGERLVDCHVRLDWLTPELSDHAPLVADFATAVEP